MKENCPLRKLPLPSLQSFAGAVLLQLGIGANKITFQSCSFGYSPARERTPCSSSFCLDARHFLSSLLGRIYAGPYNRNFSSAIVNQRRSSI